MPLPGAPAGTTGTALGWRPESPASGPRPPTDSTGQVSPALWSLRRVPGVQSLRWIWQDGTGQDSSRLFFWSWSRRTLSFVRTEFWVVTFVPVASGLDQAKMRRFPLARVT